MTEHGFHLTTFEPISGFIITCERWAGGWTVTIRHRHHAGLYNDCAPETYTALSTEELADVLGAVVSSLGARPGPGDWSEPSD